MRSWISLNRNRILEYMLKYSNKHSFTNKAFIQTAIATNYKTTHRRSRTGRGKYLIHFFKIIIISAIGCFRYYNSPEWPPISLQLHSNSKTHHHLESNRNHSSANLQMQFLYALQTCRCNFCMPNVRYLVPERLRPWRREGPLEPLHDALLTLRHTWRAANVRNGNCSTK